MWQNISLKLTTIFRHENKLKLKWIVIVFVITYNPLQNQSFQVFFYLFYIAQLHVMDSMIFLFLLDCSIQSTLSTIWIERKLHVKCRKCCDIMIQTHEYKIHRSNATTWALSLATDCCAFIWCLRWHIVMYTIELYYSFELASIDLNSVVKSSLEIFLINVLFV